LKGDTSALHWAARSVAPRVLLKDLVLKGSMLTREEQRLFKGGESLKTRAYFWVSNLLGFHKTKIISFRKD
jgi:hypothetical protein